MDSQQSREDTYIRNIAQISALVSYVRRAGLEALNEYQKDKILSLTTRQCSLIATVQRMTTPGHEGVTLSNLARELHMSASAASHLTDTLEELNLLSRKTHDEDRRSVYISLSPAGQQCAATVRQGMLKAIAKLTSQLTPQEEELRLHVIDKLYHLAYPRES